MGSPLNLRTRHVGRNEKRCKESKSMIRPVHKRLLAVSASIALLLMLGACGAPSSSPSAPDAPAEEQSATSGGEATEATASEAVTTTATEDEAAAETKAVQSSEV